MSVHFRRIEPTLSADHLAFLKSLAVAGEVKSDHIHPGFDEILADLVIHQPPLVAVSDGMVFCTHEGFEIGRATRRMPA